MPEERIEILDPALEGKAERIGFEESCRLGHRRASAVRIVVARATYKTAEAIVTTKRPRELFERCLLAPSMFAHVLMLKYGFGIPFFRCEEMLAKDGIDLGRAEMCRYAEDAGATFGAIVLAMRDDSMKAFCRATDATGVAIQPEPLHDRSRQPCRKGHFFVVLADRDHVFFEYKPNTIAQRSATCFVAIRATCRLTLIRYTTRSIEGTPSARVSIRPSRSRAGVTQEGNSGKPPLQAGARSRWPLASARHLRARGVVGEAPAGEDPRDAPACARAARR